MTFDINKYVTRGPRPLPILLLLDTSSSMGERCQDSGMTRIEALNQSVRNMLAEFSSHCTKDSAITVAAISFNSTISLLQLDSESIFSLASYSRWTDLQTAGCTCLGAALSTAKQLVEDKSILPSNAYRPLVILLTDGEPNDNWKAPMADFCNSGRSQKCDRLAIMLGNDANIEPLEQFVQGTGNPVLHANTANQISRFFKMVTMTVTQRFLSQNPNKVTPINQEQAQRYINKIPSTPCANTEAEEDDDFFF